MKLETMVAWRFLRSMRRNKFLSVIAVLSVLGVAVGVCFLIVVLAVMAGFETDLRDKIVGLDAHMVISAPEGLPLDSPTWTNLAALSEVEDVEAFLQTEVLLSAGDERRGAVLRGLRSLRASASNRPREAFADSFLGSCRGVSLSDCLSQPFDEAVDGPNQGLSRIVLGSELAQDLKLYRNPQRDIQVVSPVGQVGPFGFEPSRDHFQVTDEFRSGFYEFDTRMAFVPLEDAMRFFASPGIISGIGIYLRDPEAIGRVRALVETQIKPLHPNAKIEDWRERNQKLFAALELEKLVMFLVLMLIVLVSSLVILVTLAMLVMEKRGQMAALRSLGISLTSIRRIFLLDGAGIGLVGAVVGAVFGLGLVVLLDKTHFVELPPQYYVTTIPVVIEWPAIALVLGSAVALAAAAAILPAYQAASLDPLQWLRDE